MTSIVTYDANLRTTCVHLQSGSPIQTDAPTDNKGKGERFSPTDLIATGLGACMITTMGIKAESMSIALDGAKVEVTKIMVSDPRRIGKIIAHVTMPAGLNLDDLKTFPVPICSLEEQQQIVSELESKLTICDKIEETISQSLQEAETLKQSILKKAFEGKLI